MHACEMNDENNILSKDDMLKEIMGYDFALVELALFLDTHPDDNEALLVHNEYARKAKKLKDDYQKLYGPLTMDYPCNSWRWGESPWGGFKSGVKLSIYNGL